MRFVWRAFVVLFVLALLGALAGAVYQVAATSSDRSAYLPAGARYDIGGYRLHLNCTGEGSPTVILDHAGGSNSAQWALVQPEIAAVTRVCSYDRAGFGWSDAGPGPYDAQKPAEQLATLLTVAGIEGPYVMVGHSFGAFISRIFAADHPDRVAGMVLIDPGKVWDDPDVPAAINEAWMNEDRTLLTAGPWAARIGLMRLLGDAGSGDLPSPAAEAFVAMNRTTTFWDSVKIVAETMPATSTEIRGAPPPAIPLTVLSAGVPRDAGRAAWTLQNQALAESAPLGQHRLIEGAAHMDFALRAETAAITTAAILEMVARVRPPPAPPAPIMPPDLLAPQPAPLPSP
jgi:pimeloyl-ACP methyl ester carboxylesterase